MPHYWDRRPCGVAVFGAKKMIYPVESHKTWRLLQKHENHAHNVTPSGESIRGKVEQRGSSIILLLILDPPRGAPYRAEGVLQHWKMKEILSQSYFRMIRSIVSTVWRVTPLTPLEGGRPRGASSLSPVFHRAMWTIGIWRSQKWGKKREAL